MDISNLFILLLPLLERLIVLLLGVFVVLLVLAPFALRAERRRLQVAAVTAALRLALTGLAALVVGVIGRRLLRLLLLRLGLEVGGIVIGEDGEPRRGRGNEGHRS